MQEGYRQKSKSNRFFNFYVFEVTYKLALFLIIIYSSLLLVDTVSE